MPPEIDLKDLESVRSAIRRVLAYVGALATDAPFLDRPGGRAATRSERAMVSERLLKSLGALLEVERRLNEQADPNPTR